MRRYCILALGIGLLATLVPGTAQATWEGHAYNARLDCAISEIGSSSNDLCPGPPGELDSPNPKDNEVVFEVEPRPILGAVYELQWWPDKHWHPEPFQLMYPLPQSDTATLATNGKDSTRSSLVEGYSPLTVRLEASSPDAPLYLVAEGNALHAMIWPSPERHVVLYQSFTLAASFFYDQAIPDGYSYFDPATWPDDQQPTSPHRLATGGAGASPGDAAPTLVVVLVAAGAAGLLGAALMLERPRWHPLHALLFSRLARNRVLDHPRRGELESLVRADPGIRKEDARRALGFGDGVFHYHLRVLERHRLLKIENDFGDARLYPPTHADPATRTVSIPERLLRLVTARPGISLPEASLALGVPRRTLVYHARWLARKGYLDRRAESNRVRCYPAAAKA